MKMELTDEKRKGYVVCALMILVSCLYLVYLGYSLSSNNWGRSWIIWVVAGVLFRAVVAITDAFEKKSK